MITKSARVYVVYLGLISLTRYVAWVAFGDVVAAEWDGVCEHSGCVNCRYTMAILILTLEHNAC